VSCSGPYFQREILTLLHTAALVVVIDAVLLELEAVTDDVVVEVDGPARMLMQALETHVVDEEQPLAYVGIAPTPVYAAQNAYAAGTL